MMTGAAENLRTGSSGVATSFLTLHIRPETAHLYQARVFNGRDLVGLPTTHSSLEEAITAYGQRADFSDSTAFDIWYGGGSLGAVPRARMRSDAAALAQRLTVLATVLR